MAYTLLLLAIQLLTAIVHNPNLPQSFRDNAVSVGNQAIAAATQEIAAQASSTGQTFGSVSVSTTTATTTPVNTVPDTFTQESTTSVQQLSTLPQLTATIPNMINSVSFSGWDGTKVVFTDSSTTLTIFGNDGNPLPNTPVTIKDSFGHVISLGNSDSNGQYVFSTNKLGGVQQVEFMVPAISYDEKVSCQI